MRARRAHPSTRGQFRRRRGQSRAFRRAGVRRDRGAPGARRARRRVHGRRTRPRAQRGMGGRRGLPAAHRCCARAPPGLCIRADRARLTGLAPTPRAAHRRARPRAGRTPGLGRSGRAHRPGATLGRRDPRRRTRGPAPPKANSTPISPSCVSRSTIRSASSRQPPGSSSSVRAWRNDATHRCPDRHGRQRGRSQITVAWRLTSCKPCSRTRCSRACCSATIVASRSPWPDTSTSRRQRDHKHGRVGLERARDRCRARPCAVRR